MHEPALAHSLDKKLGRPNLHGIKDRSIADMFPAGRNNACPLSAHKSEPLNTALAPRTHSGWQRCILPTQHSRTAQTRKLNFAPRRKSALCCNLPKNSRGSTCYRQACANKPKPAAALPLHTSGRLLPTCRTSKPAAPLYLPSSSTLLAILQSMTSTARRKALNKKRNISRPFIPRRAAWPCPSPPGTAAPPAAQSSRTAPP